LLAERPELKIEIIGDREAMSRAADQVGVSLEHVKVLEPSNGTEPVEVRSIRDAVRRLLVGDGRALITGPINKERLAQRGFPFAGHTEFLGRLCEVDRPVMAFVGGQIRLALVTTHLPLRRVPDALTTEGVLHTIRVLADALVDQLGIVGPVVWVCGLNPHAGDGGVLGHEDADVVAPAVAQARELGIDARGPVSAETAFVQVVRGHGDAVVAMYHDQGLVPLKALDFGRSVNWTLGLPIVRTSVDHGTAYDIAGRGLADASSLHAAVQLADALTRHRVTADLDR